MTPSAAVKHFNTQVNLASQLQVTQPCVANWKRRGRIPSAAQIAIAALSRGALKADRAAQRWASQ
jgi:hypothetical protein